jgi:DNA repair protein RecN (Recombination protein N)
MLVELHIQDFAIIDRLDLTFEPGFIVLTGETGAGKSIIIDAVELLLGGRSDAAQVRSGAAAAVLEGTFRIPEAFLPDVRLILEESGLEVEEGHLTLAREVRKEGRSVCRINGRTVNLGMLKEVGDRLVDVHGQSEHLSLLRAGEHLGMLDRYARDDELREEYRRVHDDLGQVRLELARLSQIERDAARRAELLTFQAEEIEAALLQPGEDVALVEERTRLANAEHLASLAEQALVDLAEGDDRSPSGRDRIAASAQALAALAKVDGGAQGLKTEAEDLAERAADLARRVRLYREGIEFNPRRLEQVEERLNLIRTLERKYGGSIESVRAHGEAARRDLAAIQHAEERIRELQAQEASLLPKLGEVGLRLSHTRRQASEKLSGGIEAELEALNMSGARFQVELQWQDEPGGAPADGRRVAFGPRGLDRVEFLIAPNPGEGLKPLAKTASGGETSRLMLGLKGVLAQADQTPTLVFDEIDQGIGGRVGAVVGEKLWRLAPAHQVLCITHLPQLAAFGDQHIKVDKEVRRGRTLTRARSLTAEERLEELALMLGGPSEANRRSAEELLAHAAKVKTGTL